MPTKKQAGFEVNADLNADAKLKTMAKDMGDALDKTQNALPPTPPAHEYIKDGLIACALTVHYGQYSIMLEKRVYSDSLNAIEQAAEYDKLELELEEHHREFRLNHAANFKVKPQGS